MRQEVEVLHWGGRRVSSRTERRGRAVLCPHRRRTSVSVAGFTSGVSSSTSSTLSGFVVSWIFRKVVLG